MTQNNSLIEQVDIVFGTKDLLYASTFVHTNLKDKNINNYIAKKDKYASEGKSASDRMRLAFSRETLDHTT